MAISCLLNVVKRGDPWKLLEATEVVGMLSGIKDDTKEEIKVETATEDDG